MFSRGRRLLILLFLLLLAMSASAVAWAQNGPRIRTTGSRPNVSAQFDRLTAVLDSSAIPSGILHIPAIADAPTDTTDGWYQAFLEMQRSMLATDVLPNVTTVREAARASAREGVIPLGILNFDYHTIRLDAFEKELLRLEDGQLSDVPNRAESPYNEALLFAAAPLWEQAYAGQDVTFRLDDAFFFGNRALPQAVLADLGDGSGSHWLQLGDAITARYERSGSVEMTFLARFADGSTKTAVTTFTVQPQTPTEPDVSWENLAATIPYLGEAAVYDAYIFYGDGHTQIEKPLIFVEGFDLDNSISWPEVLEIVSAYGLADTLLADGYDLIILNFEDGTTYVQRNSFALVDLIQRVQAEPIGDEPLVVAGASMGGIIGRYALSWMEQNSMAHDTRLFLTFDSPHQTANVPLGVQEWVAFFAGYNSDAQFFVDAMDAPAARQLLIYHHLSKPDPTQDVLRAELFADLAALGDYPVEPRLVAVANGSGAGVSGGQVGNNEVPMLPGLKMVNWHHSIPLVMSVTGDVWTVPNVTPETRIFQGDVDIFLFFGDSLNVYASGTLPYDNAPGGYRPTQQEMADFDPVYDFLGFVIDLGNINTDFPNHAFVPTISALDVRNGAGNPPHLFYDLNGDAQLIDKTPFDAIYFPAGANEEHVVVTAENADFLTEQIRITAEVMGNVAPLSEPVEIPAQGGSFQYQVMLTNHMNSPEPIDLQIEIRDGNGANLHTVLQRSATLQPLVTVERTVTQPIPDWAPPGTYSLALVITTASGVTHESSFDFVKLAPVE